MQSDDRHEPVAGGAQYHYSTTLYLQWTRNSRAENGLPYKQIGSREKYGLNSHSRFLLARMMQVSSQPVVVHVELLGSPLWACHGT